MAEETTRVNEELNNVTTQSREIFESAKARPTNQEPNVVPCYWWMMRDIDPVRLPHIPHHLPDIAGTELKDEVLRKETRLIKIAGADNNIFGLTNKGHVLKYNNLYDEISYESGRWEYVRVSPSALCTALTLDG